MELKTGGLAAAPQVLPDDSHLDTYEQVTVSSGAGWRGLVFFSFSEGQNSFFPPVLGCALLLFLP